MMRRVEVGARGEQDSDSGRAAAAPPRREQGQDLLKLGAALVSAASVAALTVCFFEVHVCNDQVTQAGRVVSVCRHMTLADPPSAAFGLVALVGLSVFFSEVSWLGITLKRQIQAVDDKATAAQDAATSAEGAARGAAEGATTALTMAGRAQVSAQRPLAARRTSVARRTRADIDAALEKVDALAADYLKVRAAPKSPERTARMTTILTSMADIAQGVPEAEYGCRRRLASESAGQRLAGYAWVAANGGLDPGDLIDDIELEHKDDRAFSEYWALLALQFQLQMSGQALEPSVRARLETLAADLKDSWDRSHVLRDILAIASARDRGASAGGADPT